MNPSSEPLLTLRGVGIEFGGITALRGVDIDLRPAEVVGLIGPNGAGKSTILNIITGVYKVTHGYVQYQNTPMVWQKPHQRVGLGIVRTFQNVRLFEGLTVRENIELVRYNAMGSGLSKLIPHCRSSAQRAEKLRVDALLEEYGLKEWAHHNVENLPLGVQRRVEMARAIASNPKLLLLDEPTSGMPAPEARELVQHLKRVVETGTSVVLVEHDMSVVFPASDRVIVMNFGEKIAEGTPDEIRSSQAVIDAYLGSDENAT